MPDWLILSIAGSILLTLALNLLQVCIPKASHRVWRRLTGPLPNRHERDDDAVRSGRRIHVFFPWRAMLIGSIVLTLIVNLIGFFASS